MTSSSIMAAMNGQDDDRTAIWVQIPDGYVPLPLDDIGPQMAQAQEIVEEVGPEESRATVAPLIGVLTVFLHDLADRNAVYCGIAHHASAIDGSKITSSLVVALQEFPEKVNPRILLKDLVLIKAAADEQGQVDLVDVLGRPTLFMERVRELPTPSFLGQPPAPEGSTTKVFQLEALVPADDGAKLVSIELSTPFVEHGPEFRGMVVEMAASVSFTAPPPPTEGASETHKSIADALRG